MLTISQPITGTAGANYYLSLAREDYYLNGGEPPGRWHGGLARQFGLAGEVSPETLRRLFAGYSADGSTPLVQNAGDPGRRNGWDLTFSAPKSVSVLWSQADPETRARLQAAHAAAVASTLDLLERTVAYTRSGKGGRHWERTPIAAAVFEHGTSRALDPQLHSHALVLNLAQRRDGRTGALESSEFFALKMGLGAHYQAFLADRLHRDLGVAIEWTGQTFRLPQVPQALSDEMSKRRKAMLAVFAETGGYSAVAAKAVALATRPDKVEVARSTLFEQWQQVGREFGWSQAEAQRLVAPHGRTPQEDPAKEAGETRQDSPRPAAARRLAPEETERKEPPTEEPKAGRGRKETPEQPRKPATENRSREDQRPPRRPADGPKLSGAKPAGAKPAGAKQSGAKTSGAPDPKAAAARRWEAWRKITVSIRKYLPRPRGSTLSRKAERVVAQKKLPFVRVQVRKGYLFPEAPGWSPARFMPSYRIAVARNAAERRKEFAKAEQVAAKFTEGQKFTFQASDKVPAVRAGEWATVVRVEQTGILVQLDDGLYRRIDFREFPHLSAARRRGAVRPDAAARPEKAPPEKEAQAKAQAQAQAQDPQKREPEERRPEDQRPPLRPADAPPGSGPKPAEELQPGSPEPKPEAARGWEAWHKVAAPVRKVLTRKPRPKRPKPPKPSRKTEEVIAQKKLPFVRVQVRKGYLFPEAPGWSRARKVRSYRVAVASDAAERRKELARAAQAAAEFAKGQRFTFRASDKVRGVKAGESATVVRVERTGILVRFDDATHRRIDLREFPNLRADRPAPEVRPDATAQREKDRQEKEAEARRKREAEERRRQEEEERRRRESAAHSSAKTQSHSR